MADIKKIKLPRSSEVYNIVDESAYHGAVNNGILTLKAGEKTTTFGANQSTAASFEVTAADLGLNKVLKFKGVKSTEAEILALTGDIGDVWLCSANGAEYVRIEEAEGGTQRWEKIGPTMSLDGYVTKDQHNAHTHSVTVTGTNSTSSVSGTASFAANKVLTSKTTKHLTATASGVAVGVATTADAITGFGTHTTKNALGEGATFTTTVTPSTTNIKATATGTALNTANDSIRPITNVGSPTQVTLPTITDSNWTFSVSDDTLTIGGGNGSHEDGSVIAGSAPTLGEAKSFLTSASVKTQPTISLATGATAGTGVISVATGITSASTSVNAKDAITALGEATTAAVAKTISVTSQPSVSLTAANTSSTGSVQFVSDAASAAVEGTISGTAGAQTWSQATGATGTPTPQLS